MRRKYAPTCRIACVFLLFYWLFSSNTVPLGNPVQALNMEGESSKTEKIVNKRGLHARASAKFVDVAEKFKSKITVEKEDTKVSGRSIMGLLLLAAANGESIKISATGKDAEEAVLILSHLVKSGFYESD